MAHEDGELEEGEAASGRGYGRGGADEVVDPDSLTYIDEKIQYLLGCFQKKFEGEISAQNLGSQYGGYGTFLPTCPHSPLILSQSGSPAVPPQHGSASRSPYAPIETAQKNHFVETALDSSRRSDRYQISNESPDNPSQQMLKKAVNGPEQKAPKLSSKVNSYINLSRNTADIYSSLGLDISPSSSVEGSLDGSAEAPVPDVLPDESPRTIFMIMTCYSVPGGLLLSPLLDGALELREKPKVLRVKHEAPYLHDSKEELRRKWCCTTSSTLNNKDRMDKEKSDEKIDNRKRMTKQSSHMGRLNNPPSVNKGNKPEIPDILDDKDSIALSRTIKTDHSVESAAFVNEISDQLMETKYDPLKGHIIDKSKEIKKESSLDHAFSSKTKYDSDEYTSRSFASSSHLQNTPIETTCLEKDKEKAVYVKAEQCQYKSKEIRSLSSAKLVDLATENDDQNSSGMMKVKKQKTSSQAAPSRRKIRFKARKQLNDDITRKSYGEDENHALNHRIDLATRDKKLKLEIETISSEDTENKSCGGNGVEEKINSLFLDKSDPIPSACKNENAEPSTVLSSPAPLVINEQWVCCDKCDKWRLLPNGINPDILPKKWQCKMLNWLPGMNRCKISEDDTTRALRALYMVPSSENNILDDHCDNAASGIGTTTAPTFEGNTQATTTSGKLKDCHDGAYIANNLDLNDMSKPSKKLHAHSSGNSDGVDCFPKLKEKRKHIESSSKGKNVAKDWIPPTRSSVEVGHSNLRASKKVKKEFNELATHHSSEFFVCKNSPLVNETPKNMHKHIGNSPGTGKYDSSSSGKRHHGEGKFCSDEVVKSPGTGKSDVPELSNKKKNSKHDPDHLTSNTAAKCITKQSESNGLKEKPRLELKFSKPERTADHGRGGITGVDDVNIVSDKGCISQELQANIHFQLSLASESSTRKNVFDTQTTVAASSSSNVSNSHKDKADFQETRISPVDSVSSSPLRTSQNALNQYKRHSLTVTENTQSQGLAKKGLSCSKRMYDFGSDSDQARASISDCFNGDMDHHAVKDGDLLTDDQDLNIAGLNNKDSVLGTKNGQLNPVKEQKVNSVAPSLHDNHSHKQLTSHENEKTPPHFNSNQSDHVNLIAANGKPDKGNRQNKILKTNPSSVKGNKQHSPLDNAMNGDATCKEKQSEKAVIKNLETKKQVTLNKGAPNPLNASILLKEARDFKHFSKRLKEIADDFESSSMCFEAAVKFLNVASLWEGPSTGSSKQVDPVQTMMLYSETGNLCGFCAHEFERLKKMANAALAYKCMEVAYMKAAFFKHPGAVKDRHALQTALLMAPPAESPSSSASDVDNLNNQSTSAKIVSVRGVYSPQLPSNHISRNNHHLMGLLAYAEDINNAFEGTRKSQNCFCDYLSDMGKNQVDGVALVREALDFSFHNVKGLLQLIRQSLESINHESVLSNRSKKFLSMIMYMIVQLLQHFCYNGTAKMGVEVNQDQLVNCCE